MNKDLFFAYLKFNSIVKRPWTTQFLGLEKQRFSLFTFCCRWFSMSRSLFSWLVTISLFSFSDFLYFDVKTKNFVSLVSHRKILNSECCLKMQNLVINRQFFDIYDFWILKNLLNIYTKKIRQTLFTFQLNSAWLPLFWRIILMPEKFKNEISYHH